MSDFDIDKFIIKIEARPAIWTLNWVEYANRTQKAKAWEVVPSISFCTVYFFDDGGLRDVIATQIYFLLHVCFNTIILINPS
jgi:hypothetical protein